MIGVKEKNELRKEKHEVREAIIWGKEVILLIDKLDMNCYVAISSMFKVRENMNRLKSRIRKTVNNLGRRKWPKQMR